MNFQYTNFKILEINGKDAKTFLQRLATTDINNLSKDNNLVLTAFANLKGRIISLCFVKYISNEKFLLSVEDKILDHLLLWFKKYAIFSLVSFQKNHDYSLFFTKTILLNHDILKKDFLENTINYNRVQKENIFAKLAIINIDNFQKFLPAELNLDNFDKVISYNKGCYMGQEIIARMHYKSKFKKELIVVKSNLNIIGNELKNDQNKIFARIVNKSFFDNQYYMLVVFNNKATKQEYKLNNGQIITKC